VLFRSLSRVQVPWDMRPYFTVSHLRLLFSSPPTTRRVTVEVLDPASTRVSMTMISCCYFMYPVKDRYKTTQHCSTLSKMLNGKYEGSCWNRELTNETGAVGARSCEKHVQVNTGTDICKYATASFSLSPPDGAGTMRTADAISCC
jgi:hypothetical protein